MSAQDAAEIELVGVDVAQEDAPGRIVVRDVQWRIAAGEWWAVGASPGGGKTSLLLAAAGLAPPARGVLRIFGREIAGSSDAEKAQLRRRIGFVFEHGGRLLHRLTVAENVALPLRYHENLDAWEARGRVDELLALTELTAYADVSPSRLGPSQRQRVALARALTAPLRVLFLDNPLSGLAPSGLLWWLRFLGELRTRQAAHGEPLTVVASAYDFARWRDVADRFAVLRAERFQVLADRDAVAAHREEADLDSPAGSVI